MFRDRKPPAETDRTARNDSTLSDDGGGVLPSSQRGARVRLPEVSLVAAIFEDAVRCAQRTGRSVTHRQSEEAHEWIASERRDWPFAFVNVCDFLGVDAERVRMQLRIGGDETLH
jgi:hypothetical protein